jgi:hypothetical protein
LYEIGYNAGYTDASQNNGYNCQIGYHSVTYCNGYGAGYNAGGQSGQQIGQQQGQQQSSTSGSTSYSQSNPNVKIVINNVVPNSNNSTSGSIAPTNQGPGEQN